MSVFKGKYLATFMGYSSGTFMGRDDGHPERKYRVLDSDEDLDSFLASQQDLSGIQVFMVGAELSKDDLKDSQRLGIESREKAEQARALKRLREEAARLGKKVV